eukprot:361194-Chlamydomonas_euryale.AAC.4
MTATGCSFRLRKEFLDPFERTDRHSIGQSLKKDSGPVARGRLAPRLLHSTSPHLPRGRLLHSTSPHLPRSIGTRLPPPRTPYAARRSQSLLAQDEAEIEGGWQLQVHTLRPPHGAPVTYGTAFTFKLLSRTQCHSTAATSPLVRIRKRASQR